MDNVGVVEHIANIARTICAGDGEISEFAYQLLTSLLIGDIVIDEAIIKLRQHYNIESDVEGEKC